MTGHQFSDVAGRVAGKISKKLKLVALVLNQVSKKLRGDTLKGVMSQPRSQMYGIYLADEKVKLHVSFSENGGMDWGFGYKRGAVKCEAFTTAETLLMLKDGRIKVLNQRSNELTYIPFGVWDAIRLGRVYTRGDASSNELKRLLEVLSQREDITKRVFGHD